MATLSSPDCRIIPSVSDRFLFGANCTTNGCHPAGQIVVASRTVTTAPLNLSSSSCFTEEMTVLPDTPEMTAVVNEIYEKQELEKITTNIQNIVSLLLNS